ncbi:hypothetical protein EXIGLDRAFT_320270 [Exidia glandulosa HHB12029]|uniref:Uncharacterized protein n=1 Tax=Exidia glandulosa HHB12029 TaxID=1314781 RepID=A0A165Q519_EXIGL|nr:hypothetical protein EXIGLDRAFT_320270 [Exidia glandulosa HHB12029]
MSSSDVLSWCPFFRGSECASFSFRRCRPVAFLRMSRPTPPATFKAQATARKNSRADGAAFGRRSEPLRLDARPCDCAVACSLSHTDFTPQRRHCRLPRWPVCKMRLRRIDCRARRALARPGAARQWLDSTHNEDRPASIGFLARCSACCRARASLPGQHAHGVR